MVQPLYEALEIGKETDPYGKIEQRKLTRLRRGNSIRVMDLFSGCGGISLGFKNAGFSIECAVEMDSDAATSFGQNIIPARKDKGIAIDITKSEPSDVLKAWGVPFEDESDAIDVLVGGPPCQAYSRAGRAKLRHLKGKDDAHVQDPRANLYLRYLHFIRQTRPLVILIENVPDSLRFGGVNIPEQICDALKVEGYRCGYTIMNSVHYGVPQLRERMFLLAFHWVCGVDPEFPEPTHRFSLPTGYKEFRIGMLREVVKKVNKGEASSFIAPPEAEKRKLPNAITTKQAIGDLPRIDARHLVRQGKKSCPDESVKYRRKRPSSYARLMRTWKNLDAVKEIEDHIIRWVPRDFPIFKRMKHGDQYPEAHKIAQRILAEKLRAISKEGKEPAKNSNAFKELVKCTVPPYPVDKFPNKWRKMEPHLPSRTLLAHLGKDSYTHIHYDSNQARAISLREAARLQSFPDGFRFHGNMGAVFKQVGNAVPPLIAKKIALKIKKLLGV